MNIRRKFASFFAVAAVLCAIGVGCASTDGPPSSDESAQRSNPAEAVRDPQWEDLAQGISTISVPVSTSTGAELTLYRFDPARVRFRFAHASTTKRVSAWRKDEGADVVLNGVYFNEDNSPSGFLRIDGKAVGSRKFDLDKSGVIQPDEPLSIIDTSSTAFDFASAPNAAQSYPFLITDGEAALTRDTGLTARRSFIGTDTDGLVYLGVLDGSSFSLFELMNMLMDQPIQWDDALNLDGGPSSGIAAHIGSHERLIDSYVGVPNVIVVE